MISPNAIRRQWLTSNLLRTENQTQRFITELRELGTTTAPTDIDYVFYYETRDGWEEEQTRIYYLNRDNEMFVYEQGYTDKGEYDNLEKIESFVETPETTRWLFPQSSVFYYAFGLDQRIDYSDFYVDNLEEKEFQQWSRFISNNEAKLNWLFDGRYELCYFTNSKLNECVIKTNSVIQNDKDYKLTHILTYENGWQDGFYLIQI